LEIQPLLGVNPDYRHVPGREGTLWIDAPLPMAY